MTLAAAWLAVLPVAAWAQTSGIAGAVKDASGAVLPGVTVEAASPALIEKVRSAVTDERTSARSPAGAPSSRSSAGS
jgi:hypothetical protein